MASSLVNTPFELQLLLRRGAADRLSASDVELTVLRLFDEHSVRLRRCARRCGLPADVAEDVVQDAFLALFRHLRKGGNTSNLPGWLMTVCFRLALKRRHQWAKQRSRERSFEEAVIEIADPVVSAERQMLAAQHRLRVRAVVNALPARDRQCLSMRVEGVTYREIAAALGISLGAVAKAVARAAARLSSVVKES